MLRLLHMNCIAQNHNSRLRFCTDSHRLNGTYVNRCDTTSVLQDDGPEPVTIFETITLDEAKYLLGHFVQLAVSKVLDFSPSRWKLIEIFKTYMGNHILTIICHLLEGIWTYESVVDDPSKSKKMSFYLTFAIRLLILVYLPAGCPGSTERCWIQRVGGQTPPGAYGQYIPKRHAAVPHTGPSRYTNRRKFV